MGQTGKRSIEGVLAAATKTALMRAPDTLIGQTRDGRPWLRFGPGCDLASTAVGGMRRCGCGGLALRGAAVRVGFSWDCQTDMAWALDAGQSTGTIVPVALPVP